MRDRLLAIDWMRGFVMILMTIDHASLSYNAGRIANDSAYLLDPSTGAPAHLPGTLLEPLQFFVRWITHLCAPTFLFLSGTSLAFSLERRRANGLAESSLDWHLFVRGAAILGCEGILSLLAGQGVALLQVLYAIGLSLWLMIPLRRLDTRGLLVLGLAWLVVGEWITRTLVPIGTREIALPLRLLLAPELTSPITVVYPVGSWLAMMALGWVFGRYLLGLPAERRLARQATRASLQFGALGLVAFVLIRGLDAYGNMGLHRDDASLVQWLHVSKYPPSLAYSALELGLMGVCLAAFFAFEARMRGPASRWNPLLVYGQAALFYYMLHFIGIGASAIALTGGFGKGGLEETAVASISALVVLYPPCVLWRRYKAAYPDGWAQYL